MQPTVGEYDITQLHENTYYDVCVEMEFTTRLAVDVDGGGDFDGPHPATADIWNNNFDGSEAALGDGRLRHPSATGNDRRISRRFAVADSGDADSFSTSFPYPRPFIPSICCPLSLFS